MCGRDCTAPKRTLLCGCRAAGESRRASDRIFRRLRIQITLIMSSTPSTKETLTGAPVKHFSIFLHNKVGALLEVVKFIEQKGVVVLAFCIIDSAESAIARMIVSDPALVAKLLHERDIAYVETTVLVVELAEGAADIGHVLSCLLMAEVNLLFSYPLLVRPRDKALLVLHVDDNECASTVLQGEGYQILTQGDLSR